MTSRVQLVEDSPQRATLHVDAGSAFGLGCVALVWNVFVIFFTLRLLFDVLYGDAPPGAQVLVLGISWLVGIGLALWWTNMRFTRLQLLVEPERVSVQKILFKRQILEATRLDADSTVDLVELYSSNNQPVYTIAVSGLDQEIRFGTSLTDVDKRYLVRKIRQVTRVNHTPAEIAAEPIREFKGNCEACGGPLPKPEHSDIAVVCPYCGRSQTGTVVVREDSTNSPHFEDIEPSQLPADSLVTVENNATDELTLRYPTIDPQWDGLATGLGGIIGMLLGGFFVFVFNHAFPQIAGQSMPIAQFIGSAVLLVATTAGVVSWIKKGEIRVDLSSTQLRLRGQMGPFVVLRFLDVSEIWKVMLTTNPEKEDLVRDPAMKWQREHIGSWKNVLSCVVCAEKKNVQLTFGHGPETARQIAGLVRGRLRSMGNQL